MLAKKGDLVGRYTILRMVRAGGQAEFFEAQLAKSNRNVVQSVGIKIFKNWDDDALVRIEREIDALRALKHPNIVRYLGRGHYRGHPFIVMEFLDGEDLECFVRREGPLSLAKTIEVIEQITQAAAAAHKLGLVHRDIKPQNALISPSGMVTLLDFGIVKILGQDFTQTNVGMGSFPTWAPEQRTNASDVDCRADLYSIGETFLFLLTGRYTVCEASGKLTEQDWEGDLHQALAGEPHRIVRGVVGICRKLLQADRRFRYENAAELLAKLECCEHALLEKSGAGVVVRQSTPPRQIIATDPIQRKLARIDHPEKRSKRVYVAVAVLLIGGVAGLSGVLGPQQPQLPRLADLPAAPIEPIGASAPEFVSQKPDERELMSKTESPSLVAAANPHSLESEPVPPSHPEPLIATTPAAEVPETEAPVILEPNGQKLVYMGPGSIPPNQVVNVFATLNGINAICGISPKDRPFFRAMDGLVFLCLPGDDTPREIGFTEGRWPNDKPTQAWLPDSTEPVYAAWASTTDWKLPVFKSQDDLKAAKNAGGFANGVESSKIREAYNKLARQLATENKIAITEEDLFRESTRT